MKSIIVYYSRKGRTSKVARTWAQRIGASRLKIIPMNWHNTTHDVVKYMIATLTRKVMEIDLYNVDFSKYDRIIIMVPVICGMMSAPMRSFIRQEAGNLHNVEYVIVHKGFKIRHKALIGWLDKTLGERHVAASSIMVTWSKKYKPAVIDGDSILR
ncbi:MAG: flavodoxin domain-containing protein [Clostridiales bacterium]|nr:flavodoxin domain-containing protein [Clostridiales bacterium]